MFVFIQPLPNCGSVWPYVCTKKIRSTSYAQNSQIGIPLVYCWIFINSPVLEFLLCDSFLCDCYFFSIMEKWKKKSAACVYMCVYVCRSGILHWDEEWSSSQHNIFDGSAPEFGHANHCEYPTLRWLPVVVCQRHWCKCEGKNKKRKILLFNLRILWRDIGNQSLDLQSHDKEFSDHVVKHS